MKIYKSRNPFGWSLDHSKSFRIGPNRILNHFVLMILQDQRFKSCYIKLLNRLDVQIILNLESIRLKSRKSYSHVIQKFRNPNDNPMNALTLTLIVKFWKTHPEFFPRFQFSRALHRSISGKIIHKNFTSTSSVKYRGMTYSHEPDRFLEKSSIILNAPKF